jgi:GDPmannose 4,6-dehydratase
MLQQSTPDDYVIATGETHSVLDFVTSAFRQVGLDYRDYVIIDQDFYRPSEVTILRGDASKARRVLGWTHKIGFADLVREMVAQDCHVQGIQP